MDPLTVAYVALAGMSAWLVHRYQRGVARQIREQEPRYAEDAEVAIAVAGHACRTRDHRFLCTPHVLYGLLQDERIAAALGPERAGTVEAAALAELDRAEPARADALATAQILAYADAAARQRGRAITCVDLWAGLTRRETAATRVLALGEVEAAAVLTILCHGEVEAEVDLAAASVAVVLRDDDYTPQELVVEVLERNFGLSRENAVACMHAAEADGRAMVGRFSPAEAQRRIRAARRFARAQRTPLWIGAEP
ncbi:ATP-dependent Clp protease adapter protein ClpS [Nannocystis exedens]|uniref:ATP-dependent Clp protease adapter protein ClpS n=1 Tax=Nannocystis exedens TaxID=54 RepID=A0A1I2E8U9_9BACT|nr:ATP-dependent Clp protease adaptor ClpS [Nannocystis exedens]PCC74885.1 ATP-dependent Clp protease adapter protein ClpS [Nannocystis exedens]SFE89265.1 ATP-dependent Clp protease adapter protein ClpS [Nannocystis exedens]